MFSAKGAVLTLQPWATPQELVPVKPPALKARFISAPLSRTFSAYRDPITVLGRCPQAVLTPPLALNTYTETPYNSGREILTPFGTTAKRAVDISLSYNRSPRRAASVI